EPVHGLVVGWHEKERMMVDRRMTRDLPDAPPGGGVGKFPAFRRITLTFAQTITMKSGLRRSAGGQSLEKPKLDLIGLGLGNNFVAIVIVDFVDHVVGKHRFDILDV